MLLNNFFTYTLIEKTPENISVYISFIKNHEIYKGHFPSVPVTPGVCQIQMLKEILQTELDKQYMLTTARDIKFITMINPTEATEMQLDITIKSDNQKTIQVSALMWNKETKYFKLRADYCEK